MAINGVNQGGNDNHHNNKLTTTQQNVYAYFESIFKDLDKNKDGTIDSKDKLDYQEQKLADKIKESFIELQYNIREKVGFSLDNIRDLLNKNDNFHVRCVLDFAENVIFSKLDKNGDGIVNEQDNLTQKEKQILDNFDKSGRKEYYVQHTKKEKYNGADAEITYNLDNKIIKLKVKAQNEKEAAEKLGFKSPLWERSVDKQSNKVRYYYKGKGEIAGKIGPGDWFEWDDKSKTMKWAGNF